eukprot:scaffold55265_cov15-Tisochrysis_lutea.AAC.1
MDEFDVASNKIAMKFWIEKSQNPLSHSQTIKKHSKKLAWKREGWPSLHEYVHDRHLCSPKLYVQEELTGVTPVAEV